MSRRPTFAAASAVLLAALGSAATLAHAPALISFAPAPQGELVATHAAPQLPLTASPLAISVLAPRPSATLASVDTTSMKRVHATSLVMTLPASRTATRLPNRHGLTRQPKTGFRAIERSAPMPAIKQPTHELSSLTPQAAPARTVYLRQVIAVQDGEVRTWTMVAHFDKIPADASNAEPTTTPTGTDAQTTSSATTTHQPPPQPRYRPAYAAIPTANGWLVVEL